MRIPTRISLGIAVLLAMVLGDTAFRSHALHEQRRQLDQVSVASTAVASDAMALMRTAKDVQLDIVQVQQFLSDVSATRAQDGLDDGFTEAQRFAAKFDQDLPVAIHLAAKMGRTELGSLLSESAAAFRTYYRSGVAMAQAYVAGGASAGNRLMPEFDKASDALQDKVERVLALTEAAVSENTATLEQTIRRIEQGGERLALISALSGGAGVLLAGAMGALLFASVVRPLGRVAEAMRRMADGAVEVTVRGEARRDEIGAMARALLVFRDHLIAERRLTEEQAADRQRAEAEKRAALANMAETIEHETTMALRQVGERTTAIATRAEQMSGAAGRTGASAESAAAASGQALATAQTVASAAEQLSASIREIGGQVAQSSEVVGRAVAAGAETRATIETLNGQVARIGAVADMIGEIAARRICSR